MVFGNGHLRKAAWLCTVFILSVSGCGDGEPPTVPISGKVAYADGKPLTEGMIVFNPTFGNEAAPLFVIQKDGTFATAGMGVQPGEYRVSLSPSEEGTAPIEGEGEPKASAFRVPEKYREPDTSGWTVTVDATGNQPFTFTIGK
jgi:hypothetical protein